MIFFCLSVLRPWPITNHGMCPIGHKYRLIDLKMCFMEYPVCVFSMAVIMDVVKLGIFLLAFVVL